MDVAFSRDGSASLWNLAGKMSVDVWGSVLRRARVVSPPVWDLFELEESHHGTARVRFLLGPTSRLTALLRRPRQAGVSEERLRVSLGSSTRLRARPPRRLFAICSSVPASPVECAKMWRFAVGPLCSRFA